MFVGPEFVGEVSLASVLRGPYQSASIGYWIDEGHAGRGLVPEGVALVLRYGFEELFLHRIEAAIVPRNTRSRRVAEKLGLRDEGDGRAAAPDPGRLGGTTSLRDVGRGLAGAQSGARGRFLSPERFRRHAR